MENKHPFRRVKGDKTMLETLNNIFNQLQTLTIISSAQNVQKLQNMFQELQQVYAEVKQLQQEKTELQKQVTELKDKLESMQLENKMA